VKEAFGGLLYNSIGREDLKVYRILHSHRPFALAFDTGPEFNIHIELLVEISCTRRQQCSN